MRKTVRVRQVPSIPFLDKLVNWRIYEQFIVHIYISDIYVMFGFCKLLSISLTFYGEGLWQGFKFSCETTDNWTFYVGILKYWIDSSLTCWVSSCKNDLFTLKLLNTLIWIMYVYVKVRSVYLLNRPSMIKKYFNNIQTCLIFLNFRDKKELIFFNQQIF